MAEHFKVGFQAFARLGGARQAAGQQGLLVDKHTVEVITLQQQLIVGQQVEQIARADQRAGRRHLQLRQRLQDQRRLAHA